ncbi:hypothetical protein LOZ57_006120 [Ophidiomyces ophidiicola]|uniref:uncharacterized protein n=1 Tax=Ophidiomyces ophidiicola TaxID=1387563 RepID=UPI0020C1D3E9|nr:uncharacterized protein LOZ57_006120 [Ophidiomyces ophidiicola]KAI1939676.1 hypothetical protein LOZ57_006120 [Ophidiomyces ophidiicola]KAI2047362.1 hypothetical protein LOZ43_005664 [Ophidiomyces ophidiicola]KAI2083814.1 hypothetical protein LOZ36_005397 [Ophidiomyces ophidiicola]
MDRTQGSIRQVFITKQSTYQRPSAPESEQENITSTPVPFVTSFRESTHRVAPSRTQSSFEIHRNHPKGDGRRFDSRHLHDRPKSKRTIPGCEPWVLVKTKLGRRFVHNPDTQESFWKFPPNILKGVLEYDQVERENRERIGQEGISQVVDIQTNETDRPANAPSYGNYSVSEREEACSDEYEEVEVTDEEEELENVRTATEDSQNKPVEFNEDDIAYQLAAMGEDYGLDAGEYGELGGDNAEGKEDLALTEEEMAILFRDLLDDHRINPYTPWEKVIEEAKIIDDTRYTVLPNMKSRREVWSNWSRDRIQEHKKRKEKEEKKDPRIPYFALLEAHASPKLFWPEFKRKYRKEPQMKDTNMAEKDREKYYRDYISRLKLSESARKSDLSALLKSVSISQLNRSSSIESLHSTILTDLRYISLPQKIREPLIQAYISTLPSGPTEIEISSDETGTHSADDQRQRREAALANREARVQEEKKKHQKALLQGKHLLRHGDEEIQKAMAFGKVGLRRHLGENEETIGTNHDDQEEID